jgi:hypothetical protein
LSVDLTRLLALEGEQRQLSDELTTMVHLYELALRQANVTVFTQDRGLLYTSISNSMAGHAAEDIIGRADEDILRDSGRDAVIALKQQSLATGRRQKWRGRHSIQGRVDWMARP